MNIKKIICILMLLQVIMPFHVMAAEKSSISLNSMFNNAMTIIGEETVRGVAEIVRGKTITAEQDKSILKGKKIVIDAGHGGDNPGAVYFGSRESDNNLAISKLLAAELRNLGAEVIMTRTDDSNVVGNGKVLRDDLQARVDLGLQHDADMFVSIHNNANEDQTVHGATTFYYHNTDKKMAEFIQKAMINDVKMMDKGIDKGNFLVLRENKIPAILIEVGFISNENEAIKLKDKIYQNKLAKSIANGILNYVKN